MGSFDIFKEKNNELNHRSEINEIRSTVCA